MLSQVALAYDEHDKEILTLRLGMNPEVLYPEHIPTDEEFDIMDHTELVHIKVTEVMNELAESLNKVSDWKQIVENWRYVSLDKYKLTMQLLDVDETIDQTDFLYNMHA